MKKLSEIGTEVWPYLDATKCYTLDEPAADGHTVELLLSIEERRELVRAAIEAARRGEVGDIKKFFEGQGI